MPRASDSAPHLRTRRWDVVVLGSALPGLAAAVRLAQAGLRVLVIEEHAASEIPEHARDPFFLPAGEVLQHVLSAFGVRRMDRRVLTTDALSYQVLLANLRAGVGAEGHSAEELARWQLAEAEDAREMLRALSDAAQNETATLLENEWLRADLSPAPIKRSRAKREARVLPAAVRDAEGDLARYFEAQWRVLGGGAGAAPGPRARAYLLGGALQGRVCFTAESGSLRAVLKQRFLSRRGEVRVHAGEFEFAEMRDARGVVLRGARDEVCVGRALLLNASDERLLAACEAWGRGTPDFVSRARRAPPLRRVAARVRVLSNALPQKLAARAIWWPQRADVPHPVEIARAPRTSGVWEDLLVASTFPNAGASDQEPAARLFEAAGALLDFGAAELAASGARPLWDDTALRFDPHAEMGWPSPVEVRTQGGRARVFRLAPETVFGLGVCGELLLGLRAGDALGEKLR